MHRYLVSVGLIGLVGAWSAPDIRAEGEKYPPPATMTKDYLAMDATIKAGKIVWDEQCVHCHGKNAYPGKAPKLKPKKYNRRADGPEWVWDRVANGFRKMPAWYDVYSEEELMGVVGYILSKKFSP